MKSALRIVLSDRVIGYHAIFAKVMGGAASGVWLSQILYWDGVKAQMCERDGEEYDGWFFKSEKEIAEETGLSHRECQFAKAVAVQLGIVDAKVIGVPPTSHYRVNLDTLEKLIEEPAKQRTGDSIHRHRTIDSPPSDNQLVQIHAQNDPQITHRLPIDIAKEKPSFAPIANLPLPQRDSSRPGSTSGAEERVSFDALEREDSGKAPKGMTKEIAYALARVCGKHVKLKLTAYMKAAANILSVDRHATAEMAEKYYGDGGWYYDHDWRGLRGQRPTIASINDTWGMWDTSPPISKDNSDRLDPKMVLDGRT